MKLHEARMDLPALIDEVIAAWPGLALVETTGVYFYGGDRPMISVIGTTIGDAIGDAVVEVYNISGSPGDIAVNVRLSVGPAVITWAHVHLDYTPPLGSARYVDGRLVGVEP